MVWGGGNSWEVGKGVGLKVRKNRIQIERKRKLNK